MLPSLVLTDLSTDISQCPICSVVRSCLIVCKPLDCACQTSLSFTVSWNLLVSVRDTVCAFFSITRCFACVDSPKASCVHLPEAAFLSPPCPPPMVTRETSKCYRARFLPEESLTSSPPEIQAFIFSCYKVFPFISLRAINFT